MRTMMGMGGRIRLKASGGITGINGVFTPSLLVTVITNHYVTISPP